MRYQRVLILIVVGWYLILILGHYLNQRPLWIDEQGVLNSIIRLKPISLFTRPLLSEQEFPRFYLWCIQQFARPLNDHLLALRFFPFLAMLAAFFVWFNVVRSQSREARTLILFIGCWCASIPLVYYAAELKPYSMDVLVSGLFMLFLYRQPDLQNTPLLYRSLLFFLPLLGVVSYPVIFLYPLPLYNLIRDAYARRRLQPELLFYLGGGMCWVLFVYFFDYRVTMTGFLQTCWHNYFISLNSMGMFFKTFGEGINSMISRWFAEKPQWIRVPSRFFVGSGLLYMLINFWRIFKSEGFRLRSLVPAAFCVFWTSVMLGGLHKYPFGVPRLFLFFAPFLLWMTVLALQWLREKSKIAGTVLQIIFAGYLIFVSSGLAWDVFIKGDLGSESTLFSTRQ